MALPRAPLHITEVFGLSPLRERWREAMLTLRGDPSTPPTRFDLSSLRILNPRLALPLWAGRPAHGRLVPIYNLVSHVRPPLDEGWSVRVTTARDFVGTQLTYDSHNGTDFAVPLGTAVVAAAPGVVRRVSREFHRGGLKVFIDHGAGVITSSNHLARPLVREGDLVRRGEVIALSGYSGIDGVVTFPWGAPHVHFNVWLDGEYVDPFALPGETSMWRAGNWPVPDDGSLVDETVTPTAWDEAAIDRGARACVHPGSRAEIDAAPTLDARAMAIKRMPDFVVQNPRTSEVFFIEVKFRAAEKFSIKDLPKDYAWENAFFIVVSKKHIKCVTYKELSEGKEITPESRNYLGNRKEFDLDKDTIIAFCEFAVKFFEQV